MVITAGDLRFDDNLGEGFEESHVLLRDEWSQPALWVVKTETGYEVHDSNMGVDLATDEDIDDIVFDWKEAVEWGRICTHCNERFAALFSCEGSNCENAVCEECLETDAWSTNSALCADCGESA